MDLRRGIALGLAFLAALVTGAATTAAVIQSGTVSSSHLASWTTTGIIQDAGTSSTPKVSTLGLYGVGGTPLCLFNRSGPGPYGSTPYSTLCFGMDTGQAYIRLDSFNGDGPLSLNFIVNGTVIPVTGGGGSGAVVRVINSGSTDTAVAGDQTIAWNSGAAVAKTETLYNCNGSTKNNVLNIKDMKGTAGLYGIVLVPFGGDTIDDAASYIMNTNYQSVTIQCANTGRWIVL